MGLKIYPQWQAWWRWFWVVSLTAMLISACNSTKINHSKLPPSETPLTPCRVVQHAMGETCVPNHPKRIITISYQILGNALTLGVKPIASSGSDIELNAPLIRDLSYLGNKVEGIKNIGLTNSPNLEKILQFKPDLILAWEPVKQVYPMLSQIAPTVIIPIADLITNWKQGFNIVAEILGEKTTAQQVLNNYNQRIQELKIALGDRYQDKTISVAFAYGQSAYIYVKNSFAGSILEELGLQRPPTQDVSVHGGRIDGISEERLELLDGDILFFGVSDLGHTEAYESLKQKPLWKKLNAVQKGQVYLFDVTSWAGNNPLAADAVIDDLYKYLVNTP
ncbi:iron-siderophore ABC transporter substrate-binding protein [Nostoc sp. UHCC 0870]|uniref:iron-siderophore ABC transporter substrate-binding protein n=1 Tax=Nostoc sp. UHCC 0870 TaxID=2914041 RepID=UPI001EDDD473|nr:iron-siderophore ABC transporter substrate-binding protein [Nostoc sp. UHCC 0870]UKO96926.1 iron-siderophore ABC transporter substrate-binding protein [Nostoc sp. UHCC 0870]